MKCRSRLRFNDTDMFYERRILHAHKHDIPVYLEPLPSAPVYTSRPVPVRSFSELIKLASTDRVLKPVRLMRREILNRLRHLVSLQFHESGGSSLNPERIKTFVPFFGIVWTCEDDMRRMAIVPRAHMDPAHYTLLEQQRDPALCLPNTLFEVLFFNRPYDHLNADIVEWTKTHNLASLPCPLQSFVVNTRVGMRLVPIYVVTSFVARSPDVSP